MFAHPRIAHSLVKLPPPTARLHFNRVMTMKRYSRLLLGVLAPLAISMTACERNPDLVDARPIDATSKGPSPAPSANPAICYLGEALAKNGSLDGYTIGVVDADGSDAKNLYALSASGSPHTWATPTWSPGGTSISFIEESTVSGVSSSALKALDVSISNGVPSATNVRTLLSRSKDFVRQAWSPSSTVAEVAFVQERREGSPAQFTEWSSIRVVSLTGTETVIHAAQNNHAIRWIAWDPTGAKLAFHDIDMSGTSETHAIKILDRATATVERTLVSGVHTGLLGIDWSGDGDSLVYFAASTSGGAMQMYTLSLADGATPRSYSSVTGVEPSFSPDDRKAVLRGSSRLNIFDFTTGTTSLLLAGSGRGLSVPRMPNWKR